MARAASSSAPHDVLFEEKKYEELTAALKEQVLTASLKGVQERSLLEGLSSLTDTVRRLSSVWRLHQLEEHELQQEKQQQITSLQQQLHASDLKLSELKAETTSLTQQLALLTKEHSQCGTAFSEKLAKALDDRSKEVEAWKADYLARSKEHISKKLQEVREAAAKQQAATAEAMMEEMEKAYKLSMVEAREQLEAALRTASDASTHAARAMLQKEAAEAHAVQLQSDCAELRQKMKEAEARAAAAERSAQVAAEEAKRAGSLLSIERRALEEAALAGAARRDAELEGLRLQHMSSLQKLKDKLEQEAREQRHTFLQQLAEKEEALATARGELHKLRAEAGSADMALQDLQQALAVSLGGAGWAAGTPERGSAAKAEAVKSSTAASSSAAGGRGAPAAKLVVSVGLTSSTGSLLAAGAGGGDKGRGSESSSSSSGISGSSSTGGSSRGPSKSALSDSKLDMEESGKQEEDEQPKTADGSAAHQRASDAAISEIGQQYTAGETAATDTSAIGPW